MSRNMQGTISTRNDTLSMQKRTCWSRDAQGTISDRNNIDTGTHWL